MRPLGEAGEAVGEGADDLLVVPLQHEPALQDARRAHLEHRDAPLREALIRCKPRALCVQGGSEKQGGSGQGGRQTQATGVGFGSGPGSGPGLGQGSGPGSGGPGPA